MPHRNPSSFRLLPIAAALCGAFALVAAPTAALAQGAAQQAARSFDIELPAQALGSALNELSRQTGAQIFAAGELVSGHRAPALSGRMSVEQALSRLLAGSGLSARASGGNGFTVSQAREAVLPTVTVSGKAPGSTTEGTGSYTTFSTSSSTRLNLTPQETPQAITVLTRQRLDDQHLENLVEALDATPGIIVQQGSIGQDAPDIYARGSRLNNFQIDGVPILSGMSPFLSNTAAYDRVEVVRGATGIMNGMGTPAATVNLIRKRPTVVPQMSLAAQTGSWDRYGAGADLSGALNESGTARARLVGDYRRQGAWVDRFEQKNLALYGIAEFDLSERTLLTLGFNHLQQDTDSAIVGRPLHFSNGERIPLSFSDNRSQKWRYYEHDMRGIFASVEHKFGPGWVAKAEYSHTRYRYDGLVSSFLGSVDAMTGAGVIGRPNRWKSELKQDNLDAYVSGSFPLFGRDHEVIAGITLSKLRSSGPSYTLDSSYSTATTFDDWAELPEPTFDGTGKTSSHEHQYSAFLNARFSLTDSASLLLGGRTTRWQYDRDEHSTLWGDHATREKENVFVPYVGLVYALSDIWSLYASHTRIFRPQDDWIGEFNGPGLAPEEGQGYEAGVKASFYGGRLASSLSLFRTDVDNLAIWNNDAFMYDLLGKTRTRGVELEFNGELARNWQFGAGYAYAVTEDQDGARILAYLPRQTLKTFTSYRLPGELNKLTLGGGVNWQSAIDYRQGSLALVSLMARYEIDRNLSVSLNVNNALDKRHFSSVNSGTFGAPRNFTASLKYRF